MTVLKLEDFTALSRTVQNLLIVLPVDPVCLPLSTGHCLCWPSPWALWLFCLSVVPTCTSAMTTNEVPDVSLVASVPSLLLGLPSLLLGLLSLLLGLLSLLLGLPSLLLGLPSLLGLLSLLLGLLSLLGLPVCCLVVLLLAVFLGDGCGGEAAFLLFALCTGAGTSTALS